MANPPFNSQGMDMVPLRYTAVRRVYPTPYELDVAEMLTRGDGKREPADNQIVQGGGSKIIHHKKRLDPTAERLAVN